MVYTPIVSSLGYVLSKDKTQVLLVHRNKDAEHDQWNMYNGLGGKMEPHEDPVACIKREILEESGIHCHKVQLRGTVVWKGFGKKELDWLGFVFLIEQFEGEPFTTNAEGDLHWIPIETMGQYPMWEGDQYFLPHVFENKERLFHAHLTYKKGKLIQQSVTLS